MYTPPDLDFSDVRGLDPVVDALARAVASQRSILLIGPPGIGKTMIARRLTTILPRLDPHAAEWLRAEYDGCGLGNHEIVPVGGGEFARRVRVDPDSIPFRAPHHTISTMALAGSGGTRPGVVSTVRVCERTDLLRERGPHQRVEVTRPAEVDLARYGVLFLDELPEFALAALDALSYRLWRMPSGPRMGGMSAGRPVLVASANPCACGWHGETARACSCSPESVARYRARLTKIETTFAARGFGFDTIRVPSLSLPALRAEYPGPKSADLRMSTVGTCHDGTAFCVQDATTADHDDTIMVATDARKKAAELAAERGCQWFDFGSAP